MDYGDATPVSFLTPAFLEDGSKNRDEWHWMNGLWLPF